MRRTIEEAMARFDLEGTQRGWMLLIDLCWANLVEGKWDEAAAQAQKAVEGVRSPYLRAIAIRHLGEIRFAQGAFLEAEEHLKAALSLLEEYGGPTSTFEALADLAETQLQAGKLDKAEDTVTKLLALLGATAPDSSEAQALWTLAGVKLARTESDAADSLLERSAAIVGEKFAARNPFCADLFFRSARLRWTQGRAAEASEYYEQALALMADIGGEAHPKIAQMKAEWRRGTS